MSDRLENLLGALALGLADDILAASSQSVRLSASACAALATLGPYPGTTIGSVAQVLGVTHSVAVRLVEELVGRGLVERRPGADRRRVELHLTSEGVALRDTIVGARQHVLNAAMRDLDQAERAQLEGLVSKLLTAITTGRAKADELCRLCDEFVCTPSNCPVEREARRIAEQET